MVGYLLSAVVYGILLALCLTRWRRRLMGSGLAAALGVQFGWSLVSGAEAAGVAVSVELSLSAEYLRALVWALVLVRYLRGPRERQGALTAQRLILALIVVVVAGAVASLSPGPAAVVHRFAQRYGMWGAFALSIGGLVAVEQVARNTRSDHRWNLKYVWLGIGALYAWDLCLYSITILRGSGAAEFFLARGFVDALIGVLMAVGLRRIAAWQTGAFLSPRIIFFNATLIAASLYVFAMAAGSYFIRRYGGSWGGAAQLLFLAAGALVLAVAALSEQFRAWGRVTLAKHLVPYRYDYRSEWQKLTRALSEGDGPLYERIVRVMAGFVSATSGGLWLRDAEGAFAPVGGDLAPPGAPRQAGSGEFFDYLLRHEWICDLNEVRVPVPRQQRGSHRPPLPSPPTWLLENPRLWLIVPLICDEALVGFTAVAQPLVAIRLGWEELDLLRAAGRQVASFLAFDQAAKRLAEAHQFEAMNRLSAVLMHDLRHLIAQQALVVQNAARHRGNPEFFDDAILTIDNSVKRMTRLMDELRAGVLGSGETHRVSLPDVCAEALARCAGGTPVPTLEVQERGLEVMLNRERLLQALEHLLRNAQQATAPDGSVTLRVGRVGQQAVVEICDTGCGMDADFIRTRLFRPFDTTKGQGGFGIGAYQAREFVRKCGGGLEVDSKLGKGTRFIIQLPLAPALTASQAPADSAQVPANTVHEFQAG